MELMGYFKEIQTGTLKMKPELKMKNIWNINDSSFSKKC